MHVRYSISLREIIPSYHYTHYNISLRLYWRYRKHIAGIECGIKFALSVQFPLSIIHYNALSIVVHYICWYYRWTFDHCRFIKSFSIKFITLGIGYIKALLWFWTLMKIQYQRNICHIYKIYKFSFIFPNIVSSKMCTRRCFQNWWWNYTYILRNTAIFFSWFRPSGRKSRYLSRNYQKY